jgi:hypothetical protein
MFCNPMSCSYFASGGTASFLLPVVVTNPDVSSAAALSSMASIATNALAQAALAGDLNTASQVISSMTSLLDSAANSSAYQSTPEATAQRAAIRESLLVSVLSIANSSGPITPAAASQTLSIISSITSKPNELSPLVATSAAAFAAQAMQSLLSSSTTPLPPLLVTSALNIAGSSASASAYAGENPNASSAIPLLSVDQQKTIRY